MLKHAKKQIVIMGVRPVHAVLKIARALKLTNKYEVIFVSFKEVKEEFVKKSFDRILTLELDPSISFKALWHFLKKLTKKETYLFFREFKKLNPHVIQIHSANYLSLFFFLLVRKKPKIFFFHDIWQYYHKKISFKKNSGRMQYINTLVEKLCMAKSDGIVNKCGENSLIYLKDKIKAPVIDFLPYCLDEWIITPKKKTLNRNKEIHLAYAGNCWDKWEGHVSFKDMIEKIVNQGMHLHFYPSVSNKKIKKILGDIAEKNKFFHLYSYQKIDKIQKEISKYDYAIHLDFFDKSADNSEDYSLWNKTGMSGKIFGYIEAGLPIIINKEFENMCSIIEKNKIGKGITYEDLGKLKEILLSMKYPSVKEIKKAQDKFRISKNINRLEKFYDEVNLKINNKR